MPIRAAASLTSGTECSAKVDSALSSAGQWLERHANERDALEVGARGFALTFARSFAAALIAGNVAASVDREPAASAALQRFMARGLDRLTKYQVDDALLLSDG